MKKDASTIEGDIKYVNLKPLFIQRLYNNTDNVTKNNILE